MLAQLLPDYGVSVSLTAEIGDPRSDRDRDQRWQQVETDVCDPCMNECNGYKVYPWMSTLIGGPLDNVTGIIAEFIE